MEKEMNTIEYIMLSESNQQIIDKDVDEGYDWYACPRGKGHTLHRVQKSLDESVQAQGGMGENWLRVVYQ